MITFRRATELADKAMIRYMDAECFPEDAPFNWDGTHWHIGEWHSNNLITPAAYCGWKHLPVGKTDNDDVAFLYRAGVMHNFRGSGLQKQMITLREDWMWEQMYRTSVTCTEVNNMASIYSLMNSGYKPYAPGDELPNVAHDVPSIHWFKKLV